MKWKLLIFLALWPLLSNAQTITTTYRLNSATAATGTLANGGAANETNSSTAFRKATWHVTGTVATCSFAVDSSADGSSWSSAGAITNTTCTSNGATAINSGVFNFTRIRFGTPPTGGGSVVVTYTGYNTNPGGSGGTVTEVDTTAPLTGGPITTTGAVACPSCGVTTNRIDQNNAATTSAQLATVISDKTGTGLLVYGTGPTITLANGTGLPISTGVSGLGTGIATFLATPSSANLAAAVTDETGSGALVFGTAPTITLANATGLPISTGISGLGAGVATFLATPSSANLAGALTDETGAGLAVFGTAPTFASTVSIGTNGGTAGGINLLGSTSGTYTCTVSATATSLSCGNALTLSSGNLTLTTGTETITAGNLALSAVTSTVTVGAGGSYVINGRSRWSSSADGLFTVSNNGGTGITRLNLGLATDSGPALGVSGTAITVQGGAGGTTVGSFSSPLYATNTNCAGVGTAASPSVVSCAAAPAGAFSCATNASAATCTVNTTAVTANSEIVVTEVADEGTRLSVTCNTAPTVTPAILLATKTAATGFTINMPTITVSPACFDYTIIN